MKRPWLAPLTPLYAAGVAWRNLRVERGWEPVRRLAWPVVSVGNLSAGGSGKTPLTIALACALKQRGLAVDVLSRGYGRRSWLPARVRTDGSAEEFGDEPLLIAQKAEVPVYVAAQRYEAGLLAEAEFAGCGIHLLDDGFQHQQLHRDVNILLLNREDWQDGLLPSGNLREPLRALRRATVIAIPAEDAQFAAELKTTLQAWGWQGSLWQVRRTVQPPEVDGSVAAFCGIARPAQFFAGLDAAGLRVATRMVFADHHRYTARDLDRLAAAARAAGALTLVTTEKDLVRLGRLATNLPESLQLKTMQLRVEIERENEAVDWLIQRLGDSATSN